MTSELRRERPRRMLDGVERQVAGVLALAFLLTASGARAADGGAPSKAAPSASAAPTASARAGTTPTAPAADDDGDEAPMADPHGGHGHGRGAEGGAGGMFQAPEDGAIDDPTLPIGTLDIHVADPSGKPLPNTNVTLGVLYNSVAKGESRKRLSVTTNATGVARLEHLETGSTVAYRPMVLIDGATFSVMPFRLPEKTGMRALLHVYPVVDSIESSLVVTQSILYTEVKDDRIQVQQAFTIYNFGRTAWVPRDLVVPLPEAFTAFTTQQGMSDVGVDAVPKKGVRIHGTFGPGQHMLEFRWQLPYSGEAEVRFDVGMAPHMAAARVIAPASKDMTLEVPGFPPPKSTSDGTGQRALITEKQLRKEEAALSSVAVVIRGLPTEGPAKIIATLLAAGGLVLGLVLGAQKPTRREPKAERARLLAELEDLERARLDGDVGPKTYEKARREILDALTRTFADEPAPTSPRRAARSRAA
ncbi:MAG: hypothetical protein K0S65_3152 [Labilithrix sp.]|nr:hypothetical protein [Labilithrix sp.]